MYSYSETTLLSGAKGVVIDDGTNIIGILPEGRLYAAKNDNGYLVIYETITKDEWGARVPFTNIALPVGTPDTIVSTLNGWFFFEPVETVVFDSPQHVIVDSGNITENNSLAIKNLLTDIKARLPTPLGQQLMSASLAVVIASNQSAVPISATSLPLPTGAATEANQTTANSSLSSIVTNTGTTNTNIGAVASFTHDGTHVALNAVDTNANLNTLAKRTIQDLEVVSAGTLYSVADLLLSIKNTGISISNNINTSPADNAYLDAFGRIKVNESSTQFSSKYLADLNPQLFDRQTIGTGASSQVSNESSNLITTSANNDAVICQTYRRFNYQNGKSIEIQFTFAGFSPQSNVVKRIGYFSSNTTTPFNSNLDGIFLESSGGVVSINVYRNGTAIDSAAQSTWDDKLDGTGASGVTINWANAQIFSIDFQWLGVGRVRLIAIFSGKPYVVHTLNHTNILTKVYMVSPNQPFRYEIRQTGAGSGSFTQICVAVNSDNTIQQLGTNRSENTGVVAAVAALTTTYYAVCGIRLKSTYLNYIVELKSIRTIAFTPDDYIWELQINPTLSAGLSYSNITNSAVQFGVPTIFATPPTLSAAGEKLASGHANGNVINDCVLSNIRKMGASLNGTSDQLILLVRPFTINLNVDGAITWEEL